MMGIRSDLPFIILDEVIHVGSLDAGNRTGRASLEGPCLSVSLDPEAWSGIARIAGPQWLMTRPGARWLDACSLSDLQEEEIVTWAVEAGFVERTQIWRAWWFDDEIDGWVYSLHDREAAAWSEVLDPEAEDAPTEDGSSVDSYDGHKVTQAGLDLLERWGDPLDGLGGAIILYAIMLSQSHPDICGVWWNEDDNPLSLSCPRGGILPSRLCEFAAQSPGLERREAGSLTPERGAEPSAEFL